MDTTVFGVFGGRAAFERVADPDAYDAAVAGDAATVGVRDDATGIDGRTSVHRADDGFCVCWGEAFFEPGARGDGGTAGRAGESTATALYGAYRERGERALADLNGSYLAIVEHRGRARVYTDQIRSWECYYTDAPGVRVFGTDAARVARTIPDPTRDRDAVRQFAHFGNVFDDGTLLVELERVPFDGYLGPDETGELRRFVYRPREFDYAGELAARLRRAIERRSGYPGTVGLLLSAGYDSRIVLSELSGVDRAYSIGHRDADEVAVARRLTDQYGGRHRTLPVDGRYLRASFDVVQYSQGIRESLHIHHRGNNAEIDADTMFHGMFFDTLFRGWFLPRDSVDLFGHPFPRYRLVPEPDPATHFANLLGCFPDDADLPASCPGLVDGDRAEYAREVIEPAFEACLDRADSVHNAIDLLGIKLKPTLPFRTHLADHYLESFVACDAELLEWHLMTLPEHRNDRVFLEALERLDDDILRHRPPNRPHDSFRLNQIEGFLRRTVPGLTAFETPWPDRDRIYERHDMDQVLFPRDESIHRLSPRLKLRINDATSWLDATVPDDVRPTEVVARR